MDTLKSLDEINQHRRRFFSAAMVFAAAARRPRPRRVGRAPDRGDRAPASLASSNSAQKSRPRWQPLTTHHNA
jgi:hypothetical protein